ncbi:hypothetical protein NHG25_01225 [Aerococcaceae bacterium NML191292]|nr:hypothetical protein [Aerococcaceae bacterium NML210727]MCW6654473.1 hypothetical protein [Aerococcaceae bacterium NML201296]MCW6659101.1 hypothetical protein [Aerococcaceae bacterium NML191292]MCW6661998.1 hypothetical protein [Aerococcaceae bacterium NML201209]MCW6662434.1 hypothetical protein [Aerococcaceae bacterium NML190073]MCW6664423.1 hypothetical protein [Aerococcaceae bacterium NML191219]MCW6667119.1 hypothetical protein [Aerococcaceae bacterium NML190938]MCW6675412.1 hypothetic
MDWQKYMKRWQDQAKDYPTKALLAVALKVNHEQQQWIANQKAKLDGMMWSPDGWRK